MHHPDTALVEQVLGVAALCAGCIVQLTGLSSRRLADALPRLIGALRVASALGPCGACLEPTVVHRRSRD
jgi:hypothetical protein